MMQVLSLVFFIKFRQCSCWALYFSTSTTGRDYLTGDSFSANLEFLLHMVALAFSYGTSEV